MDDLVKVMRQLTSGEVMEKVGQVREVELKLSEGGGE